MLLTSDNYYLRDGTYAGQPLISRLNFDFCNIVSTYYPVLVCPERLNDSSLLLAQSKHFI